jgi:general secretion pathway protein G
MWAKNKQQSAFTIVELLIVIVVIGILAAIVIVAYNGIQNRAKVGAVTTALSQYKRKLQLYQVDNGQYPVTASDVGITDTDEVTYQYTVDTSSQPGTFCLTSTSLVGTYYVSNTAGDVQQGVCNGYNLLTWNKTNGSIAPVPTAIVDSSTFRTSLKSMRLGPNSTGVAIKGNPYTGNVGQTYTVSLWMKTDSNWNGTGNNSKIRFGSSSDGSLLNACGYSGIKATWTQATCSFTLTSTNTSLAISVGNDGSVGNIWIDDFSLTKT